MGSAGKDTGSNFLSHPLPKSKQGREESPGLFGARATGISPGPGSAIRNLGLFGAIHFLSLNLSFFVCRRGLMFGPSHLHQGWKRNWVSEGPSTKQGLSTSPVPGTANTRHLISFSASFPITSVFDVCSTSILVLGNKVVACPFPKAVRVAEKSTMKFFI